MTDRANKGWREHLEPGEAVVSSASISEQRRTEEAKRVGNLYFWLLFWAGATCLLLFGDSFISQLTIDRMASRPLGTVASLFVPVSMVLVAWRSIHAPEKLLRFGTQNHTIILTDRRLLIVSEKQELRTSVPLSDIKYFGVDKSADVTRVLQFNLKSKGSLQDLIQVPYLEEPEAFVDLIKTEIAKSK